LQNVIISSMADGPNHLNSSMMWLLIVFVSMGLTFHSAKQARIDADIMAGVPAVSITAPVLAATVFWGKGL
jgi:hypothetical protein